MRKMTPMQKLRAKLKTTEADLRSWKVSAEIRQEAANALAKKLSYCKQALASQYCELEDLRAQRSQLVSFKTDLMVLVASQWDVQCGSRLINVKAIEMLLRKYE